MDSNYQGARGLPNQSIKHLQKLLNRQRREEKLKALQEAAQAAAAAEADETES